MRSRLRSLSVVFAAFGSVLVPGCSGVRSRAEPARNLLVICIDTLRADRLGSYGHTRDTSPTFDSLASGGALFEDAIAQAPWTVPAIASLFTSLLPSEHGAELTGPVRNFSEKQLPGNLREDAPTLAETVAASGFRSALFSANPFLIGGFGRGFESATVARQDAAGLTDQAIGWLETRSSDRFFLYIQYMDLHEPLNPPESFADLFPVTDAGPRLPRHGGWAFGRSHELRSDGFENFRAHRFALYDAALRYVDSEVSRLIERLRELDVLENTLIVLTSDHGEEFWEHAELEAQLGGDPRGISGIGHGHSMFQELLRIPLVFFGPGVVNRRLDCPVQHIDVAPTALALLGLQPAPGMRGRDLSDLLTDSGSTSQCREVPLIAQSPAYGVDAQALIVRHKKLITRADGQRLLFDLANDPGETRNLAPTEARLVELLTRILEAETRPGAVTPTSQMELDEDSKSQLKALGYLN